MTRLERNEQTRQRNQTEIAARIEKQPHEMLTTAAMHGLPAGAAKLDPLTIINDPEHALQTITTTYLPPGNVRGARMRAKASGGASIVVSYDHAATTDYGPHIRAAQEMARRFGWSGKVAMGACKRGYVFVFTYHR